MSDDDLTQPRNMCVEQGLGQKIITGDDRNDFMGASNYLSLCIHNL